VLAALRALAVDRPDGEAQNVIHRPHPAGVTLGEVVVDGDKVRAAAVSAFEIQREGRDQGLALTGSHLRDPALVEYHSTDHLDVEMAHAECADARLPHDRERFRQKLLQLLSYPVLAFPVTHIRVTLSLSKGAPS